MKHIKSFVQELATKGKKQTAYDWQQHLFQHWPEAIGQLSHRMRVEGVRENVLIIGVYDVHWMHELYMMTADIRDRINTYLGGTFVQNIQFKLAQRRNKPKQSTHKSEYATQQPRQLSAKQKDVLDTINDTDLAQALMSFWSRCH